MFVNPSVVQIYMEERVKDALRKGEQERLKRLANSARLRLLDRVVASIGGLLLSTGKKLQERHAPAKTSLTVSQSPRKPTTRPC